MIIYYGGLLFGFLRGGKGLTGRGNFDNIGLLLIILSYGIS